MCINNLIVLLFIDTVPTRPDYVEDVDQRFPEPDLDPRSGKGEGCDSEGNPPLPPTGEENLTSDTQNLVVYFNE